MTAAVVLGYGLVVVLVSWWESTRAGRDRRSQS